VKPKDITIHDVTIRYEIDVRAQKMAEASEQSTARNNKITLTRLW